METLNASANPRRRLILAVMVLSLLVVVLDNSVLTVALKTIADPRTGLGASQSQLEWAINAYVLVFASLLFAWSFMGDRFGRRRALLLGLLIFGAASIGSAYAADPGQLIAFRALMGFGAASIQPVSLAIVVNVFPPRERAWAIGIWSMAAGLALAIGPLLGGFLLEHFWWGSIFMVNVPVVLVLLAGTLAVVPPSRSQVPGRLDLPGLLLSMAGLFVLTYGIIHGGQLGNWTKPGVYVPLLVGMTVLAAFAAVELLNPQPALDVRLFANRRFTGACAAIAVAFFGLMGMVFALLFYLQAVRGYEPLKAAACIVPVAIAQILVAPQTGIIVRRLGHRTAAAGGLLIVAACFAGLATLDASTPLWLIYAILFIYGVGLAVVAPPVTELMMSAVPADRPGAASATNTAIRQVGTALGVAVLGALLSFRYRQVVNPKLGALPLAARRPGSESIEQTFAATRAAVRTLPPAQGHALMAQVTSAAQRAFIDAMQTVSITAAAVTFIGAVLVTYFLSRRPASGMDLAKTARPPVAAESP